jgi:hypothetical protein
MPQVKLEDDCWLSQGLDANSAGFEKIAEIGCGTFAGQATSRLGCSL